MSQKTFRPIYLKISFCLICLFASAPIVSAQDKTTVSTGAQTDAKKAFEQRTASTLSMFSTNKRLYDSGTMMILLSAVKTPEEFYSFKPTESIGSFAQMLALVVNLQYGNCSAVLEEKNSKTKIDGTKASKAELIAALKDAFAYCGKAYDQMTDESAAQVVTFSSPMGPVPTPKHQLLSINIGQNAIHYGNLMIYMRLKNIVPPSDDPEILKQAEKLFKKQ